MYNLENLKAGNYEAHYSRYIASWRNAGGKYFYEEFEDWLESEGIDPEQIREVVEMAACGKLELEMNAKKFVKKEKKNTSANIVLRWMNGSRK